MMTITIDEKSGGVLMPLRELVRRLPIALANEIRLRDFRMHFGQALGLTTRDFENSTRSLEGVVLDSESFLQFLSTDMQIIDGAIEVVVRLESGEAMLLVECIDATQWELSSESSEVMTMIAREE